MKKLGMIAAWLAATSLATLATVAAVRLVGSSVTDQPSATTALAATEMTTTTDVASPPGSVPEPGVAETTGTTIGSDDPTVDSGPTTTTATTSPSPSGSTGTTATTSPTTTLATTTTTTAGSGSTTSTTVSSTTTTTTSPGSTTTTTSAATTTGPFVYTSSGGSVTVSCQGDAVSLNGAVPTAGYTAEVEDSGPERVRVEFSNDDEESEIQVECSAGVPDPEISEG